MGSEGGGRQLSGREVVEYARPDEEEKREVFPVSAATGADGQ
jgi:hypothetical protein